MLGREEAREDALRLRSREHHQQVLRERARADEGRPDPRLLQRLLEDVEPDDGTRARRLLGPPRRQEHDVADAALGDRGRGNPGDAVLQRPHIRRVGRRRREQEKGPVGTTQRPRQEGPIAELAGDDLGALTGEGLGLVDVAHDGADFVARGEELASNDGSDVTGSPCDDEDGHAPFDVGRQRRVSAVGMSGAGVARALRFRRRRTSCVSSCSCFEAVESWCSPRRPRQRLAPTWRSGPSGWEGS